MDESYKKSDEFFITGNQDLQFILAKVRKLREINKKVMGFIDPTVARFCQVANITGNRMVILVTNSSAATQLRFQTPDILKKIQKDPTLKHIREIQPKMGVPEANPANAQSGNGKKPQMSAASSEIMRELANSLSDQKLRDIMLKLAEHSKKE
jgi:hypothetical protein